jgi:hypothetical protein
MRVEHVVVFGFEAAIRGMRNPMNSWDKSDSIFYPCIALGKTGNRVYTMHGQVDLILVRAPELPNLGAKDLTLACKLVKAGSEERKFLRLIHIQMDIEAPRYLWQEIDTYKVATVRMSCSTMHKLGHTDLSASDFQDEDVNPSVLERLNKAGRCFREKLPFHIKRNQYPNSDPEIGCTTAGVDRVFEGYDIVRWMKRNLPEGFLQKATYDMSYETALSWLRQRGKHRLPEWKDSLCGLIRSLPYMAEFEKAARNVT